MTDQEHVKNALTHAAAPPPMPPLQDYTDEQQQLLARFAERYIWWKPPHEALVYPERVIAQVMNIGTFDDLCRLVTAFTNERLRMVLRDAEPGWFSERSWFFWHYRLAGATLHDQPPPLPTRFLPEQS